MSKPYVPKISFDVDEETFRRYSNIDWGLRGRMMGEVTRQVMDAIEVGGTMTIYLIITGKLKLFTSGETSG